MRYKIVADDGAAQFEQLLSLLDRRQISILLKNDFRHMVAVEVDEGELLRELEDLGVRVRPDSLYVPG
jgi:hypothetical protein